MIGASYLKRAAETGGHHSGGATAIIVEGANHYAGKVMEIINSAPHDDLPLILTTLVIVADDMAKADNNPALRPYCSFLKSVVRSFSSTQIVTAVVPAEDADGT